MAGHNGLKLSSNWTNIGIYGGAILVLIMLPILYNATLAQEFHMGMVIAGFVYLALMGFMVYQFIYASDAQILNDKIVLKKQFRPSKSYAFDKIGQVSSFRLKNTNYITVKMMQEDGQREKYLILNSSSFLAFENKDAKHALITLRDTSKNK